MPGAGRIRSAGRGSPYLEEALSSWYREGLVSDDETSQEGSYASVGGSLASLVGSRALVGAPRKAEKVTHVVVVVSINLQSEGDLHTLPRELQNTSATQSNWLLGWVSGLGILTGPERLHYGQHAPLCARTQGRVGQKQPNLFCMPSTPCSHPNRLISDPPSLLDYNRETPSHPS